MENLLTLGEPLKGNWREFFSCPVGRVFNITYLHCAICRKKGDYAVVACSDCAETADETLKFVVLGPHDDTYGR